MGSNSRESSELMQWTLLNPWCLLQTHAILDQADGQSNKFGEKFEGPFRRHVVVLEAVRSRKPVIYHKFAHKFYMEAS